MYLQQTVAYICTQCTQYWLVAGTDEPPSNSEQLVARRSQIHEAKYKQYTCTATYIVGVARMSEGNVYVRRSN